ncbi:hypothetical protein [Leptolyngbya ohadii]|uniref:hypothetical protein n=1 Tax=Leptolyngbya ohadii TaxID=1962290 RepID=UPI000B59CFD5|nr:hypothetical protein [Leptolyngbya ohadii]
MSERQFLQLDGFTKAERITMTDRVSQAINQAGAWITDFHQYSNVLICINFEVSIADVGKLSESLQETGLHLSQESLEQLMAFSESTLKQKELPGTLQITFIHNEPDMLRDIPAVPG